MLRSFIILGIVVVPVQVSAGVISHLVNEPAQEGGFHLCMSFEPVPDASEFPDDAIASIANIHMSQNPDMTPEEARDLAAVTMMGFVALESVAAGEETETPRTVLPDGTLSLNCGGIS